MTVIVTAIFPSLTVISDGIPLRTVIITDMTCICLLIHRVTYLYSLIFPVLQNMIHMDSCTLFFRMKSFLPEYSVSKVPLDSAHDAMPYYQYFKRENITPFIDLNGKVEDLPFQKRLYN